MKLFPQTMDFVTNLNRAALARVLFGKPLINWPAVQANRRNYKTISDEVFNSVILPGLREQGLTAWVYFYNYGKDMCAQMTSQLHAFNKATYPVLIMQGKEDKGQVRSQFIFPPSPIVVISCLLIQPKELFDGTASMEIVEAPADKDSIGDRLSRFNKTHKVVTHYSTDGSVIGPTAEAFFPNRLVQRSCVI